MKNLAVIFLAGMLTACNLLTPDQLPSFSELTITGDSLTNKQLEGKVVVMNVWATWCGPCRAEIPQLNALRNEYLNDSNIVFIAVTDEPQTHVALFLANKPFNYQHIVNGSDLKNKLLPGAIKSIPQHFIIDKQQQVAFQSTGTIENNVQELRDKIEELK